MLNMNNISKFIKVLLLACLFTSCKLQPLYDYQSGNVLIPVELDWSGTNLESSDFSGASVWLFPKSSSTRTSSSPIEYKLNDYTGGYIDVAPGDYDVLMFNKTVTELENIGNVGFRGTDSFETFEYYKKVSAATLYNDYGGDYSSSVYYKSPDRLAVESRTLSVTEDMLSYNSLVSVARANRSTVMATSKAVQTKYNDLYSGLPDAMLSLVGVEPVSIVNTKKVSAYVENANNAAEAEMLLTSSPTSVFLHDRSKSTASGSVLYTLVDSPTYDEDAKSNGTFEVTVRHFGSVVSGASSKADAVDSKVELLFKLRTNYNNSEYYPLVNDGPFNKGVSAADMDKIYNEVVIDKAADGEENEFILPAYDSDDGGFKPGVGGWPDDDIIIPLG